MKQNTSKLIGFLSLAAFLLAIPAGLLLPEFCEKISFLGTVYVNLLKVMIVPVLMTGIVTALSSKVKNAGKITLRAILLFIGMFAFSFALCSLLWTLLRPGVGAQFTEIAWEGELTSLSLADFFTTLFPTNILAAMEANSLLPVILFSFALGLICRREKLTRVSELFEELNRAFGKMLSYIMLLTPAGAFALLSDTVANYGSKIIGTAALYIGCAYGGCLLIMLLVMILPVWIFRGISPFTYIRKVSKIWLMTLTTCSSAATLPNTIRTCNQDFGIPAEITDLVVPLGCTIHMCGGAVSFSLLAMFTMQMTGMQLTFGLWIAMLFVALLINMGAPGIPGGGIVIGATYLSVFGIPLQFIGFYAGIYRLLDMAYTTMNVTGDITANLLIAGKAPVDKVS